MLKLQSLVKKFNLGKANETSALNDVSLTFPHKGLFVIIGPSGSGKSTLLSLIGALDAPNSGQILFNDKDVAKMTAKEADKYRREVVSFIFQDYNLIDYLSLKKNAYLKNSKDDKSGEEALKKLNIDKLSDKKPATLSGGEKERCAIARAILSDSKIVLCDEPTASLDSKNAENVLQLLRDLSEQKLVIVVSHDEVLCRKFTDNIIYIRDGIIENQNDFNKELIKEEIAEPAPNNKIYTRGLFSKAFGHTKHKLGESLFIIVLSMIAVFCVTIIVGLATGTRYMVDKSVNDLIHLSPVTVSSYYDNITSIDLIQQENTEYVDGINVAQTEAITSSLHKNVITKEFVDYLTENPQKDIYFAFNNDQSYSIIYDTNGSYSLYDDQLVDSLSDYVESFLGKASAINPLIYDEDYFYQRYDWVTGRFPTSENEAILVYRQHKAISEDVSTILDLDTGGNPIDAIGKKIHMVYHDDIYFENDSLTVTGRFVKDKETLQKEGNDLRAISNYCIQYVNAFYDGDVDAQEYALAKMDSMFKDEEETKEIKAFAKVQNPTELRSLVENNKTETITIVGIAEIPDDTSFSEKLTGILIPQSKLEKVREKNSHSKVAMEINNHLVMNGSMSYYNVPDVYGYINMIGDAYNDSIEEYVLKYIDFFENRKFFSVDNEVSSIEIYAPNIKTKNYYTDKIDEYNKTKDECFQMKYLDLSRKIVGYFETYFSVIEKALYSISIATLVVSGLLSLAIFLNMALSRIKEIGILRACGYSRGYVFGLVEAEGVLFGLISGLIGVGVANIIGPILSNKIASVKTDIILRNLITITPLWSVVIVLLSIAVSFLAALIPSIYLSNKKPSETLKS